MIHALMQSTADGATYLQAIIEVIALVGVLALWVNIIRDGIEGRG